MRYGHVKEWFVERSQKEIRARVLRRLNIDDLKSEYRKVFSNTSGMVAHEPIREVLMRAILEKEFGPPDVD